VTGCCEDGNEHSGSVKCLEFFTSWRNLSFSRKSLLCEVSYLFCYL